MRKTKIEPLKRQGTKKSRKDRLPAEAQWGQKGLIGLMDKLGWDTSFDEKSERSRRGAIGSRHKIGRS